MAKVIGIMGLAGAGKDTVAQMLQRGLVGAGLTNVTIGGFADYLRTISKEVGLDPFNRDTKETPVEFSGDSFEDDVFYTTEYNLSTVLPDAERATLWANLFDVVNERFFDEASGLVTISPRQFMQTLGEAGRKVRDTFWIELAQKAWQKLPGIVLVTDCRFDNEAAVADKVVLVARPGVSPVSEHISEKLATDLTYGTRSIPGMEIIENTGDLEDLEVEVATFAVSHAILFAAAIKENV